MQEDGRVLSHLSFPVAVSVPSPRNIQWSEDGQLFVLSRNAIHILTPDFNADCTLFSVHNPKSSSESTKDVEWFTNRVEIDKELHHNWAADSDNWGTLSLGSLDISWVGMALSPTNSSKTYCCVLAALTSNLEVSLWGPCKNHISGEWQKIQDVTETIKDSIASPNNSIRGIQQAQIQCLAWSKGVHIHSPEGVLDESSILALGNRAGSIICMKYSRESGLSYLECFEAASNWIVEMVWSPWSQHEDNSRSASIFCSTADGAVYEVQMEASARSQDLKIKLNSAAEVLHPADFTPVTALSVIQHQSDGSILVYTKPGLVNIRKITRSERDSSVVLAFPIEPSLHTQDPFAAIAGIVYYEDEDYMQIHASDGIVYKVTNVMDLPQISIDYRFLDLRDEIEILRVPKEESDKVYADERTYISGVIGADHAGAFGWFYECRRPNDFSYKLDSQHISFLGLACLRGSKLLLLNHISSHLSATSDAVASYSMPLKLRETLIYLNHHLITDDEMNHIWDMLQKIPVKALLEFQSSVFSENSQDALFLTLFQNPPFSFLRFRLTITNCLLSLNFNDSPVRDYCDQLIQSASRSYMQAVLQQLQSRGSHKGSDDDENFVLRWLVLCHTSGDILRREATAAADRMGIRKEISTRNTKICEFCPACHVLIPVDFENEAVCENGHRWQRCSITSFILATPNVRTCVGCRRKTLLPGSLKLPSDLEDQDLLPSLARSGFVNDLLEAVHWCIYCENRFVRLL